MNDTVPSANGLSRVQTLSEPGRWSEYSREHDPILDVVQAVDFTLSQASAGGGNLLVLCDVLTIDGAISVPGKMIWLVARRVVARNGATIDTTALAPSLTVQRAQDGRAPGQPGDNGEKGADGSAAGAITLVCGRCEGPLELRAVGGNGANGQDGGTGAVGPTGPVGLYSTRDRRPADGGRGLVGGAGGMGGPGGNGGAAGDILVLARSGDIENVTAISEGGKPGANGAPGKGGTGGLGGQPGEPCFYQPPTGKRGTEFYEPGGQVCWDHGALRGPEGPQGADGPINSAVSTSGLQGICKKNVGDWAVIAPFLPITQLKMSLSYSRVSLANLVTTELAERLDWIRQIAGATGSGERYYDERKKRAGAVEVGRPSADELTATAKEASILLHRLATGLDAFGHTPSYVSHLAPRFLTEASDRLLNIAGSVESEQDKYLSALSNLQDASEPLKNSFELAKASIQETQRNISEYDRSANHAQDEIAELAITVELLKQELLKAEAAFRRAVESKGDGCPLLKTIQFVAGVIALCYGAYNGLMAIANSFETANAAETDGSIITDLKVLAETFDRNKVSDYFKKMQEGYAQVEDALKTNNTKLVVSLESFESELQQYLDMPEAVNYRDLMRQFVDVTRAKNDKQLFYTQLVLKAAKARVDEASLRLEAERVQRLLAHTNNPALSECVSFLTALVSKLKLDLLELLDLRRRSLIYETLVPIRPVYKWSKVVELRDAQTRYDQALLRAMEARGGEKQSYDVEFHLTKSRFPWTFGQLARAGEVAFAIPLDEPQFNRGGTSFVTLTEVAISIPGLRAKTGQFTCRLTHQGNPVLLDRNRVPMNFTHTKRVTILSYNKAGNDWKETFTTADNLGGSDEHFLYLSPFATWSIRFEKADGVDLSHVNEIHFHFKAQAVPANSAAHTELLAAIPV